MALHGIDIASWQSDMNVRNVTADFVIIKATGGTGYVNPSCDKHFQQAKQAGKLLGVYHYANEVGYEGTAKQEADFFVKNAKNYLKGDAIPVLDWEASNKGNVKWALDWLKEVERQTGIKPWFYTYTAVLNSYDFTRIANNDNALWVANYGANNRSNGYNKNATPPSTRGFKNGAACFQYSSNTVVPGYGSPIDVDIFYGDKNAWKAYATPDSGKDWSKNYYTTNPLKIKTKKSVGIYAGGDTEFKKKKTSKPKGTILYIRGIKHAKNGCPRLITTNSNLVSANKKYVKKIKSKDWSKEYYVKIPKKVKTKVNVGVYAGGDTEFKKKLSTRKVGTIITIRGIKHAKNGCPRLITTGNKLITANKKYVKEVK